ncbi:MAG: hypothetical protein M1330_03265 [Armatimonadetes bacterium]|nr:hypothetical protein [Armatimonadota bacterium]
MKTKTIWMAVITLLVIGGLARLGYAQISANQPPQYGGPMQPGMQPPMAGMMPQFPLFDPAVPNLPQKLAPVIALRQIVQSGLTKKDIADALPILKQLAADKKELETAVDSAISQEKQHLLSSSGDDSLPAVESSALRTALNRFHRQQQDLWNRLNDRIGDTKAHVLQSLVSPVSGPMPMMMRGMPGRPSGGGPFGPPNGPSMQGGPPMGPPNQGGPQTGPPNQGALQSWQIRSAGGFARQVDQPGSMPRPGMGVPMMPSIMPFIQRISLTDLIQLLEQRLAAMPG